MKKFKFITVAFFASLFLYSCQSNEQESLLLSKKESHPTDVLNFMYKGQVYKNSEYYVNEDSSYTFLDDAAQKAYESLYSIKEPAILVESDSTICIFNNNEELDLYLKRKNKNTNTTIKSTVKSTGTCILNIYEADNYQGRFRTYINSIEVTDLGDFDNIVSSFTFVAGNMIIGEAARLTFYRSANFKDSSLSFVIDGIQNLNVYAPRLRSYKLGGFLGIGSSNWNDIISSFKMFI